MMNRMLLLSIFILIVLIGCAVPQKRELSTEVLDSAGLPNGEDLINPLEFRRAAPHGGFDTYEQSHGRPLKILQLSGGGQNGAFGSGVLMGWAESGGTRPPFDIVTGISSGALMATFAFLGTPEDDRTLQTLFTNITASDIFTRRGRLNAVFGGNALMDTTPLADLRPDKV